MNKKLLVPPLLMAVLALLVFSPCALTDEGDVGVEVGQRAPDFDLPVVDGNGDRVLLYDVVADNDATLLYFFLAAT